MCGLSRRGWIAPARDRRRAKKQREAREVLERAEDTEARAAVGMEEIQVMERVVVK